MAVPPKRNEFPAQVRGGFASHPGNMILSYSRVRMEIAFVVGFRSIVLYPSDPLASRRFTACLGSRDGECGGQNLGHQEKFSRVQMSKRQ